MTHSFKIRRTSYLVNLHSNQKTFPEIFLNILLYLLPTVFSHTCVCVCVCVCVFVS